MANARKSLGRGLSALIPDGDMEFFTRVARGEAIDAPAAKPSKTRRQAESTASPAPNGSHVEPEDTRATSVQQIAEWIDPKSIAANPYQPRRVFAPEEMQELIDSVREHGILQPILVRPLPTGEQQEKFQLVAGERRWRAACAAGLEVIPAIVRQVTDQQSLELALIENVQRHDISAVDAALAYRRLADDFSLSQAEIAQRVGKSRSSVANTLRLLDLPDEVRKALEDGVLTEGHGRAILSAPGEGSQRAIFRRILRDKLSVREAERLARQAADAGTETTAGKSTETSTANISAAAVEYRKVAQAIQKNLGGRVSMKPRAKGGQIVIRCMTQQELERVAGLLASLKTRTDIQS